MNSNRILVDFDKELRTNFRGYNTILTRWWNIRASNKSHTTAYKNIANYVTTHCNSTPSLVVDYGCGTGRLLGELAIRFVETKFIGIDGSSAMLKAAKNYLTKKAPNLLDRIKLIKIPLPTDLPLRKNQLIEDVGISITKKTLQKYIITDLLEYTKFTYDDDIETTWLKL